jgi:GTP cyclohydrolase IA
MINTLKSNDNIVLSELEIMGMQEAAEKKFGEFLTALNFDWRNDVQMRDTPHRVAKMYVQELYKGCYMAEPKIQAFDNEGQYDGIVFQGDIDVESTCAHHTVPFIGKAYVAYIPDINGKVIGLSKFNRIVEFFCKRPQIQENLTMQIHDYLNKKCEGNHGVAVVIKAQHLCVKLRGIKQNSTMITNKLSGAFMDMQGAVRQEFYDNIKLLNY